MLQKVFITSLNVLYNCFDSKKMFLDLYLIKSFDISVKVLSYTRRDLLNFTIRIELSLKNIGTCNDVIMI